MTIEAAGGWCAPSDFIVDQAHRVGVEFLDRRSLLQLARDHGLRRYSRLCRVDLVAALQRVGVRDVEVEMPDLSLPAFSVERGGIQFPLP